MRVPKLNAKMLECVTTKETNRSIAHARKNIWDATAKVNIKCIVSFKAVHTCVTKQTSSVPLHPLLGGIYGHKRVVTVPVNLC